MLSREQLLSSSVEWIDSLESQLGSSGDPAKDSALQEQAEKDFGKFSSHPRTRAEMDAKWGRGRWRPYRRFVIYQHHNDKWRAIDDGSAALHNGAISAASRVHTSEPVWVAEVARRLWHSRHKLASDAASVGAPSF